MRHTREHTGNRRSHHALKEPRLSTCKSCKESHLRHHACDTCGKYKDRQVIDVQARIERKDRREKAKKAALGEDQGSKVEDKDAEEKLAEEKSTDKPLDATSLSKK